MAVTIGEVQGTVEPAAAPEPAPDAPTPPNTANHLREMEQNLRRLRQRAARLRAD